METGEMAYYENDKRLVRKKAVDYWYDVWEKTFNRKIFYKNIYPDFFGLFDSDTINRVMETRKDDLFYSTRKLLAFMKTPPSESTFTEQVRVEPEYLKGTSVEIGILDDSSSYVRSTFRCFTQSVDDSGFLAGEVKSNDVFKSDAYVIQCINYIFEQQYGLSFIDRYFIPYIFLVDLGNIYYLSRSPMIFGRTRRPVIFQRRCGNYFIDKSQGSQRTIVQTNNSDSFLHVFYVWLSFVHDLHGGFLECGTQIK